MPAILARVTVFKEGDSFVAVSPDLNVSSYGDTIPEAKQAVAEAIEAFMEDCELRGTLHEVLEEAGFVQNQAGQWIARAPIAEAQIAVGQ
jgi:predicted RNase H-like HicB family nuclease